MPQRILLLDDSEFVLEVLRGTFEAAGFAVSAAENLAGLEEELATIKPDLIVLDVQMPEAFGDDVATVLRHVRDVRVPMVLFSSLPAEVLEARVRDAEIDGYVTKGDGVHKLLAKVRSLLGPQP